ncbi:MAG: hypothetical protein JKX82_04770 [Oleispira sp.]|nr:hypothetical protein [Oleispira sp.]
MINIEEQNTKIAEASKVLATLRSEKENYLRLESVEAANKLIGSWIKINNHEYIKLLSVDAGGIVKVIEVDLTPESETIGISEEDSEARFIISILTNVYKDTPEEVSNFVDSINRLL